MSIYTMKHKTIKFSSVNPKQVDYYEKVLSGVTETDIKENKIEGRHQLIINAGLAGDFPLFDDYMRARGIRQKEREYFNSKFSKYATTVKYNGCDMLIWDAAEKYALESTLDQTGWVL